ncbi:MAG: DUF5686 family protein [bacterium]
MKVLSALFLFVSSIGMCSSQTFTLSGTVRDAVTSEGLPAANVRVSGTPRGTIANAEGGYRLTLEPGEYEILFSYVGYRMDTLRVVLTKSIEYNAKLNPMPVQMAEVIVTTEDPAMGIMRKVIDMKHRWIEALKSYQFDAFTRQIVRRDTAIASITESYSTGYWQKGDTIREYIKQKRQTENIKVGQNFAAVGGIINFYDDEIRLAGFRIVGPTSEEAFDYYDFKLEKTLDHAGIPIYIIKMIPKSRVTPLLQGTISIVSSSYAVAGVDVTPNEAFTLPFISELSFRYMQQFDLYESMYWMPKDIRVKGFVKIGITGFSFPPIGVEQYSTIYDYKINAQIPDSIFRKPRRIVLTGAEKYDSLFWAQREVLPLTGEEKIAYKSLDSTQTLDKQFRPGGVAMSLADTAGFLRSFGFLEYVNLRFNRVEGLALGPQFDVRVLNDQLRLFGSATHGFSNKRNNATLGLEFFLTKRQNSTVTVTIGNQSNISQVNSPTRLSLELDAYQKVTRFPDENVYGNWEITLGSLLSKVDYGDYYYTRGIGVTLHSRFMRNLNTHLSYRREEQTSAHKQTDYSFFVRSTPFRGNPSIDDGTMSTLALKARYGSEEIPFELLSFPFLEAEIEHSSPRFLGSSFDFTRTTIRGEYQIQTFSRRMLFPQTLRARITAGTTFGTIPQQRWFSLESSYDGYAPFGVLRGGSVKEFSGDRFVVLSLEHNFRTAPFLYLNIPFFYKNNIDLVISGSIARTWKAGTTPAPFGSVTNGWYSEAGMGLSKIFGLLRLDATYRFAAPRGFHVSFGIAQIL